jgi:hypothetical protein
MSDDQAPLTVTHRIHLAKYHGDRTPADGEPDEIVELEWTEEQGANDGANDRGT